MSHDARQLAHASGYRLGRLVVPRSLARAPRLLRHLAADLPAPPAACNWVAALPPDALPMDGNDAVGDCVFAAMAHLLTIWTATTTRVVPTADQVLAAYSAETGYDPADPNTDQGADPAAAFNWWRQNPIAGISIDSWAAVNYQSQQHVEQAIAMFGGLLLGFQLPDAVLPTGPDAVPNWILPPGTALQGAWAPDPDNGHEVLAVAYDEQGLTVATWGQLLWASWPFLFAYCDQADVALASVWPAPPGLDLAGLRADMPALNQ